MDMYRESFDEYRSRGVEVPQPDGAGDLGDDVPSIVCGEEDVEEQVGLGDHGTVAPGDVFSDFDLPQVGGNTAPGYQQDQGYPHSAGGGYEGEYGTFLTPEDHQFCLNSNRVSNSLPAVDQFNLSVNPSNPPRDPRQPERTLDPAIKFEEGNSQENMKGKGHLAADKEFVPQGDEVALEFSSLEEAMNSFSRGEQTSIDTTLPQNVEDKKREVRDMMKAIMSVDKAQDNEGMVKPFRERKYRKDRIETACWHVLELCIQRHVQGPLLDPFDVRAKQSSKIPDFRSRMLEIIDALEKHKTICKHLLDAPYLYSFVDDPVGCRTRVVANRALNKRKGEVMSAGKEALGGTPNSGSRGRPRKNQTPGSNRKDTSSSIAPGSDPKRTPRETPRSRADSAVSAHTPGFSPGFMESPTPANHSALRGNRRQSQFGSPHPPPPTGYMNYGNTPTNPYDDNFASSSSNPFQQTSQFFSQSPGLGARPATQMPPPNITPTRSSLGGSNDTSARGTKRGQLETDDNEDIFNPHKRTQR